MSETKIMAPVIRTRSGNVINVLSPDPDQIIIEDIAHSLAHQARFNGHTKVFYSVAQHCVKAASMAPDKLKLCALLHDAAEAYIGDVVSPVKYLFPELIILENQILKVIAAKFGFSCPLPRLIKQIDAKLLKLEMASLMHGNYPPVFHCHSPRLSKNEFLATYYSLIN